jgi:hypothetical protein
MRTKRTGLGIYREVEYIQNEVWGFPKAEVLGKPLVT